MSLFIEIFPEVRRNMENILYKKIFEYFISEAKKHV